MVEYDAMPYFLSSRLPGRHLVQPTFTEADLSTHSSERVLWQGHLAVAEFALTEDEPTPPRWSLPDTTEVTITDRRVAYAHVGREITAGETRWFWPQHLRVQPGERTADSISEIHLVCGPTDGAWPTLVLAGGDVADVRDADRVANLLRRAIVQFRLDNAAGLGLSTPQSRMLSRLLITPEFGNYPGGAGQTVPLPGAFPLVYAAPLVHAAPLVDVPPARPVVAVSRPVAVARPVAVGANDETRPLPRAAPYRDGAADTLDLAYRASSVAARVAEMVRTSAMAADGTVRPSAARFAANSGPNRGVARRPGPSDLPA